MRILPSENQRRLETAKTRIEELEPLVFRYREEYEKAEAELVSLSFEEVYKNIEEEWVQAATDFFRIFGYKGYKISRSLKRVTFS